MKLLSSYFKIQGHFGCPLVSYHSKTNGSFTYSKGNFCHKTNSCNFENYSFSGHSASLGYVALKNVNRSAFKSTAPMDAFSSMNNGLPNLTRVKLSYEYSRSLCERIMNLQEWQRKHWFAVFVNFCVINTPAQVNFKLTIQYWTWELIMWVTPLQSSSTTDIISRDHKCCSQGLWEQLESGHEVL